jgi:hypothetical protein
MENFGIMIDLETTSVAPNAMILTFAAVAFDHITGKHLGQFYKTIDLNSYKKYGVFTFDAETLAWWANQDKEARIEAFCSSKRVPILDALQQFVAWYSYVTNNINKVHIWSHGASFDIPILSFAFNTVGIDIPWKFWNIRCTRTLFDDANFDFKTVGSVPINNELLPAHHALGDVARQIEGVRICKAILKK